MNVEEAYGLWSSQYDSNLNKTRDLEGISLRETLSEISFSNVLEIGCGTGKNTEWLMKRAQQITAIDLSANMLEVAKSKIQEDYVDFIEFDILNEWSFSEITYDLVVYSLVLEHIKNLDLVFQQMLPFLKPNALIYIGELHPFKQYAGSKARFMTEKGEQEVTAYTHHLSEFTGISQKYGFNLEVVNEYFDNDNRDLPRILTLLLKKK